MAWIETMIFQCLSRKLAKCCRFYQRRWAVFPFILLLKSVKYFRFVVFLTKWLFCDFLRIFPTLKFCASFLIRQFLPGLNESPAQVRFHSVSEFMSKHHLTISNEDFEKKRSILTTRESINSKRCHRSEMKLLLNSASNHWKQPQSYSDNSIYSQ